MAGRMADPAEYPPFADLIPCLGCCCIFSSCYCRSPDCYGCTAKSDILNTRTRSLFCKYGRTGDSICLFASSECDCTECRAVCKTQAQLCCSDTRCAVPSDEDTPCVLNCCWITLYFRDHFTCTCCAKGSELN